MSVPVTRASLTMTRWAAATPESRTRDSGIRATSIPAPPCCWVGTPESSTRDTGTPAFTTRPCRTRASVSRGCSARDSSSTAAAAPVCSASVTRSRGSSRTSWASSIRLPALAADALGRRPSGRPGRGKSRPSASGGSSGGTRMWKSPLSHTSGLSKPSGRPRSESGNGRCLIYEDRLGAPTCRR